MNLTINARKFKLKDSFRDRAEKKLKKLDKFFGPEAAAVVTVTLEAEDRQTVEITVRSHNMVFRSEKTAPAMEDALEAASDAILKQIVKNKSRLTRGGGFRAELYEGLAAPSEEADEGEEYDIARTKTIVLKPMTPSEAILQMNLVGHQFFLFTNAHTGRANVVYCRNNGGYGLIETESI